MKTLNLKTIVVIILVGLSSMAFSQETINIKGKVSNSETTENISYANVAVYSKTDSTLLDGTVCNENGEFEISSLPAGDYYLKVTHIAYNDFVTDDVKVDENTECCNKGELKIKPKDILLEEVIISSPKIMAMKTENNTTNSKTTE